MLLLVFSNSYGVFIWSGPAPLRTVSVQAEYRSVRVV